MNDFYTDVIQKDSRFTSTEQIRDIELLEPNVRQKVVAIIADAKSGGHSLMVLETYRSQQRQEQLFREGKTQLERVGVHHYGLACDLGFLLPNGSVNWEADYSVLGELAKDHEMIWGGDWGAPEEPHSFRDYDHVQWCSIKDQTGLFAGTWYPSAGYKPYSE